MPERSHPSRLDSLVAGAAAGFLESGLTYPTEYIKTRQQLSARTPGASASPFIILKQTLQQPNALKSLYGGAGPFVISNAAKSAVRFFAFDAVRNSLPKDSRTGKPLPSSNFLAGLAAGVAESVLVVTPGETLKTRIIDDRRRLGGPQFRGSIDAIRQILLQDGPSGLYKGVVPVTLKQSSNAMVRFTSYNFLSEMLEGSLSGSLVALKPVLAGALAGVVTVYCSQPFDTVKTRLQALNSGQQTQSTLSCIASVVRNEGLRGLWVGTTPRLARLTVSGAISFTVYENILDLLQLWRRKVSPARDLELQQL